MNDMTKEKIEAAIDAERTGLIHRILARLGVEAAPPAKDRAAEMAEKMIVDLENDRFHFKGIDGKTRVPAENYKLSIPMIRDLRNWLADAIRACADEVLEKAMAKMVYINDCVRLDAQGQDKVYVARVDVLRILDALKSSAPKP